MAKRRAMKRARIPRPRTLRARLLDDIETTTSMCMGPVTLDVEAMRLEGWTPTQIVNLYEKLTAVYKAAHRPIVRKFPHNYQRLEGGDLFYTGPVPKS